MKDDCFLWENVPSPVFFPNPLSPKCFDTKQVKLLPLLKSPGSRGKEEGGAKHRRSGGCKDRQWAQAGVFLTVQLMEVMI